MENLSTNSLQTISNQLTIDEIRGGPEPSLVNVVYDSHQNIKSSADISFSILSYNILADVYAYVFSQTVEQKYLDFSYRSPIVMEELSKFNSDIICLQEVDHFGDFYKAKIEELGYDIIFAQRPNGKPHSILIGVKKDIFEILSHEILSFDDSPLFENRPDLRTSNVAIVAQLKHKASGEIVNVINTHLYFDPKFDHVKYAQMHDIIQHVNSKLSEKDTIVWAGDFNSKPNSNAIQYVLYGTAPSADNLEFPTGDLIDTSKQIFESLQKEEKKIKWGSVYQNYGRSVGDSSREYPLYTNYTAGFKDTIDHILYSKNNLTAKMLMKIPSETEINSKALPNARFPSDHLPLLTVFDIIKKTG